MEHRIQVIAGIIFSLVFVGILSTMNTTVLRFGTDVNRKVGNTVAVSENYELRAFDDTRVSGDTVISAINNRDTLGSNVRLDIQVDGVGVTGTYAESGLSINPNTVYAATLLRNDNDVIQTISFERVP